MFKKDLLQKERLGNGEFVEALSYTPGVHPNRQGGGWGDSEIFMRGFDNANVAVMINGIPVNDMEYGTVYWSNWAGLSEVTSSIQVQRGIGVHGKNSVIVFLGQSEDLLLFLGTVICSFLCCLL